MMEIAIESIIPNPDQPRKHFDKSKLEELAQSIKEHGLMEPLVLVKRKKAFMIVAGERRYHASKLAGLKKVPARVIRANSKKIAELALLENLQREDLNIVEEAMGYKGLLDMGLTMEEVAGKMGFKQVWRVQERLNLLNLDPLYQDCLVKGLITPSQAQELSRLPMEGQRILFEKIKSGQVNTYNKLRSLANAILYKTGEQEQTTFILEPTAQEKAVKTRYDRMIEKLLELVSGSFSKEDLKVIGSVLDSNLSVNIERVDMIINYLSKVKRAMVQAESARDVLAAA